MYDYCQSVVLTNVGALLVYSVHSVCFNLCSLCLFQSLFTLSVSIFVEQTPCFQLMSWGTVVVRGYSSCHGIQ